MRSTQNKIIAGLIFAAILGSTAMTYAASGTMESIFTSLGFTKSEVQSVVAKQQSGETLTSDETTLLETLKEKLDLGGMKRGGGKGHFGPGGPMGPMSELTAEETTALEGMSDEQKQQFFETKRTEMEAKMEARETVIDKKLNDVALTDAEKVILEEIKTQRAEMKAKKLEMKTAMEAIKPILEKKRAGETLSADEQTKLDAFEAQFPHGKGGHKGGKGGPRGDFGEKTPAIQ